MAHRISAAVAISGLLMLAGASGSVAQPSGQRPPPPMAIPKPDPSIPQLEKHRLDYSHCQYPLPARRAGVEGCCRMEVEVAADGSPRVAGGQCTDDVFLSPSQACLAPQSYTPALRNGKPVKGIGEIVVYFQLQDPEPSLWSTVMGALFGLPKQQAAETPDWDICEKRPGDMISSLPSSRG